MTKRIYKFDNLKYLLILLVVIGHFIEPYTNKFLIAKKLFIFIYTFHMPLFIFITGLFTKDYKTYKNTPVNKILFFIVLIIMMKIVNFFICKHFNLNTSFTLLSGAGYEWYLAILIHYILLIPIINKFDKRILFILSIITALFVGYDNSIGNDLYLSRTIVFLPYFLSGYYFSNNKEKLLNITNNNILKIISLIILIAFLIICFYKTNTIYNFRMLFTGKNSYAIVSKQYNYICTYKHRLIAYIISFIISFTILCLIPNIKLKLISTLGTRTLAVYVLHKPVINLLTGLRINNYLYNNTGHNFIIIWICIGIITTLILSIKYFQDLLDYTSKKIFK